MVLSAGYGGSLRAFILNPPVPSAIRDLWGVLRSGLPWEMVLYGAEAEAFMEEYQEEPIKTIWAEKVEVPYEAVAFERVRRTKEGLKIGVRTTYGMEGYCIASSTTQYIEFTVFMIGEDQIYRMVRFFLCFFFFWPTSGTPAEECLRGREAPDRLAQQARDWDPPGLHHSRRAPPGPPGGQAHRGTCSLRVGVSQGQPLGQEVQQGHPKDRGRTCKQRLHLRLLSSRRHALSVPYAVSLFFWRVCVCVCAGWAHRHLEAQDAGGAEGDARERDRRDPLQGQDQPISG